MNRSGYLPDTLAAIAGVAFCVLLLLAFASVDPLVTATDQELTAWWSDAANQRDTAFSMYFLMASVPCFFVFLAGLRGRLAAAEGGTAPLSGLLFAFGIAFGAAALAGDIGRGAIGHSVRFGDEPLPGPETLRMLTTTSQLMVGMVAMPLAALTVVAASVLMLRTKAFAAWLGWSGLIVAAVILVFVALLAGPWASPLLQLWLVAASVELWRTRGRASVAESSRVAAPAVSASRAAH